MQIEASIFNTSSNLPLFAAEELGCFRHWDVEVAFSATPNSDAQRTGLAEGRIAIAHAAVDNAVAMVDRAGVDVVVVCGGDAGMNDFMVREEIAGFEDLHGKTLAVDAPNTAYALVAKKILKDRGLLEGRDYQVALAGGTGPRAAAMVANPALAMGMVNPPFSFTVRQQGLKSLGSQHALLGPYQATGAFVLRSWAERHGELLVRYLAAVVEGQRAVLAPGRRNQMLDLLKRRFALGDALAQASLEMLQTPGAGLARDAAIDAAGFAAVLAIRAEMAGAPAAQASPQTAARYLKLDAYEQALAQARRME